MGIIAAKNKLKEIISFELLDTQGSINTKGNYIHLSTTSKHSPLETKYSFIISIVGFTLTSSEDAIEPILVKALEDIYEYEISYAKDLEPSSKVIKFDELFAYELRVSIVDKTK